MTTPPVVLAIAGTDSGGAAGLTADVATLGHFGVHAAAVVTAVTAQDTTGVHAVHPVPLEVVAAQLDAVLGDLPVAVAKTGMLGSEAVLDLVAHRLKGVPLVVDPVLVATSGARLAGDDVVAGYRRLLLPQATVATPNLDEARALAGRDESADMLAGRLSELGCAVVVTGGPEWRPGGGALVCEDWLCLPGGRPERLLHDGVPTTNDHGSGCTFASAVAALIAISRVDGAGADLTLMARAGAYVAAQLEAARTWHLGRGRGPISHLARPHHSPTIRRAQ